MTKRRWCRCTPPRRRSTPARSTACMPAGAGPWCLPPNCSSTWCPGWNGDSARPCFLTSPQGAFISLGWCCTRRTSSTSRACWWCRHCPSSCSPPWRAASGAATPARRRSTAKSSCGSNGRSKVTAPCACAWTRPRSHSKNWSKKPSNTSSGSALHSGLASPLLAISPPSVIWACRSCKRRWARGRCSGCCFMALPPTATQVFCASRCVNTCALMPASRVPCSTATP